MRRSERDVERLVREHQKLVHYEVNRYLQRYFVGEMRAAVRSAVAQLPAPDRQLIERRYYEEVPVTTLAREWGISRQGFYMRQRQALRHLRAALSPAVAGEAP